MPQKPKSTPKPQPKPKAAAKVRKPLKPGFFKRNSFAVGLFLIAFLVFANGISNNYALDDEFYTGGGNKLTQKGIKAIPAIFKSHTFFNNDGSSYSYRPVALTSFAIETQFFGEDPQVSHFFNVLLYALTIVLLFSILRKWFVTQGDWFSFFVCLIFLVHPLHTEVVDNIKCRDELLMMIFMLLTLRGIWKHIETKKWIYALAYPLFFGAGVLSKETAIPFYVLIPLSIWYFASDEDLAWKNEKIKKWITLFILLGFTVLLAIARKPSSFMLLGFIVFLWFAKDRYWKIALYLAPLVVTMILTSFFQKHNLEQETRSYLLFENPLAHPGFGELTSTAFYVMGRYLFLHFIPYPLAYYYGSYYIPTISWSNPIAIASLIVFIAIGIWTIKELRKKTIVGYGLLFFLINLGAYSNLLQRAPGIMAERFTYAASLGFAIVVVAMIFRLMKLNVADFRWKSNDYKRVKLVIISIAVLFTVRTVWRTTDWADKETLYGHDMEYLHESVKANMLYGALVSKHALETNMQSRVSDGRGGVQINKQKQDEAMALFLEARGYYKKAAEMAPYYHTAWSNLGTGYFFTGETRMALSYFLKGVSIKDDYAEGWFNVGMAYDKLDMKDSAVYGFSKSIKSDSSYLESYEQLSRIRMQKENNPDEALRLLRLAARHKPTSESPWTNMASIYKQLNDTAHFEAAMEMAVKINPDNLRAIGVLVKYYQDTKNMEKFNYYNSIGMAVQRKQQALQKKQQEKMQ
jgi:tetratricopeptide (TPR) repeat protein